MKPDTQGSSHHWTRGSTEEEEEEYCCDLTKPSKFHHKAGWKHSQKAAYWIHMGEHRRKALRCGKRKPHAIITNRTVPPDCIERVISQCGEMAVYQQSSTPRPAPQSVLASAWHEQQQQQQQQQDVSRNSGKLLAGHCPKGAHSTVQKEPRDTVQGPKPKQCCERRKIVPRRSSSSWSITRRHLQRRGADDRDAKFG